MTYDNCNTPEGVSTLTKPKICTKRGLVCNIGINDTETPVRINGKLIKAYSIWSDMLVRCYSADFQKKQPTYIGCSVSKDWHFFSNFEKWFISNYVEGCQLDKDILLPDNKVYNAEVCVFVPQKINKLLLDCKSARGEYPLGVSFHKGQQKYMARVSIGTGVTQYLGSFSTPLEAHRAYQLAKAGAIEAAKTDNLRIKAALALRAAKLRDDHANNRITVKI